MATMSAGDALAQLASAHPHQEIIRYEHKNVKWTLKHVNYYSDALACGLVDAGLQPGDVMLSWLPMHFAEQVSLYFNLLQPDNIDLQAAPLVGDVGSLFCERLFCGGLRSVSDPSYIPLLFSCISTFFNLHAPRPVLSSTTLTLTPN